MFLLIYVTMNIKIAIL